MKYFTKSIMCVMLAMMSLAATAQNLSGRMLVTATMDGMQNGVSTKAMGVATIMLSPGLDTACINISWNGLSGAVSGIHIHEGKPGAAGNVVTDLSSFVSGNHLSTMITGSNLTAQWVSKLLSNQYYINLHTAANPNGEIRGQLMLSTDWSFVSSLDNIQAGTSSQAYGLGVFNLSADKKRMWYQVVVQGLSDSISGIHLHKGAMGQSGGVLVDLDGDVDGNVISGWIKVDSILLSSLVKGDIYLNIHNTTNPGGEIRGQLMPPHKMMAYSWIDGAQAGVNTKGKGVATYAVNMTMDTLWYDIVVDGLSDSITGIHLHYGFAGQSGGVAIDLDGGVMGNHIKGYATGASVSKLFLAALVRNGVYVNIHTAQNPGGEIRGQVMRLAREGFTIGMDQVQNGVTGTNGMGSGYVSIDASGFNAEVLVVMDNMTEQPTGIHFHSGPKGGSGGVILDLYGWFMPNAKGGTVWGYWENDAATSPLTMAVTNMFWHDSVYINAHTTAHPGGEIRGQVLWGSGCYAPTTTGIQAQAVQYGAVQVYPNPASEMVSIRLPEGFRTAIIEVYDATGRLVMSQSYNGTQNNISVAGLPAGLYIIKTASEDKIYTASLMKN